MRRMRHLKPREIQGCQLALDASIPTSLYDATSGGSLVAANGAVARWEDQSGRGYHVTQSGTKPTRKVSESNGYGGLDLNGSTWLESVAHDSSAMFSAQNNTIVAAMKQAGGRAQNGLISADHVSTSGGVTVWATYDDVIYWDAPNISARISVAQPSGWDNALTCLSCVRDGANVEIRNRGKSIASAGSKAGSVSYTSKKVYVGSNLGDINFQGIISTVSIFNVALGASVLMRMEHSQMRKMRING